MSFNCGGLNTAKEQLKILLQDLPNEKMPIVILIQETKLSEEEMLTMKVPDYRPITATKTKKSISKISGKETIYGGSMVLVNNKISAEILTLQHKIESNVEIIGIEIRGDDQGDYTKPSEIWSVYCPPYEANWREMKKILENFT